MTRYFLIVKAPHPFDLDTIPANVQDEFRDKGLAPVHPTDEGDWGTMPGTRIYQGKRLIQFECQADEVEMQALLDTHGLSNFEIMAYRTEALLPDPASTDDSGGWARRYTCHASRIATISGARSCMNA